LGIKLISAESRSSVSIKTMLGCLLVGRAAGVLGIGNWEAWGILGEGAGLLDAGVFVTTTDALVGMLPSLLGDEATNGMGVLHAARNAKAEQANPKKIIRLMLFSILIVFCSTLWQ
jgi:hypothetical protein